MKDIMIKQDTSYRYLLEIAPNEYANAQDILEENKALKEEIKQLKDKLNCDLEWSFKYDGLKERIDKAIEYIEHERFKRKILLGISEKKYTVNILNDVIKILKGGNNE